MGVKRLPRDRRALIAAGRDPDEPAAVIERGTLAGQRTVVGDARRARRRCRAEADQRRRRSIVVGAGRGASRVARLARAAPPSRPQRRRHPRPSPGERPGRRACAAWAPRSSSCRRSGSCPGSTPSEVRDAVERPAHLRARLPDQPQRRQAAVRGDGRGGPRRARAANATVAAIGPGTAAALAEHGIDADIVPERSSPRRWSRRWPRSRSREARSWSRAPPRPATCSPTPWRPRRRGRRRGPLRDRSPRHPTRTPSRPRRMPTTSPSPLPRRCATSSTRSASRPPAPAARVVSIGPVTSEAAREAGLEVDVEAERHDIDGLVEALLDDAGTRS